MKYTIGSKPKSDDNDGLIYVNDDARIASKLIDILCEYIDKRIDTNNYTAKYIWKILYSSIGHLKNWVNKHDVAILLDAFEKELKNRRK